MAEMPDEYLGREQTWLKHRVLHEYLQAWAHKLGSIRQHRVHLWYVDCFAGPWESQAPNRSDTSIAIGLRALNDAETSWAALGNEITLHAVFVEKDPAAYDALRAFVAEAAGTVDVHTFPGAFGDHVDRIDALIGTDPAFVFVDPTGWQGADLQFIAKLGGRRLRDLMVNVMYDHINRFKDDKRDFLRHQMRDFFGLGNDDLPGDLDEAQLMALYRRQLAQLGQIEWVADLAVPVPTRDRTKFRLVVAGHDPAVIALFRDVERKVIGADAARVRAAARDRSDQARTGQLPLVPTPTPSTDRAYADDRKLAEQAIRELLPKRLLRDGPQRFGDLWPRILCAYHLTLTDLGQVVSRLGRARVIEVRGMGPRERSVKDHHVLAAVETTT